MSKVWHWINHDDPAQRPIIPDVDLNKIKPDKLYTYNQLAKLTGLQASTLRSYRATGRMPQPAKPTPYRPEWYGRQIIEWWPNRPGRGAPGQPKPRHQDGES